MDLKKYYDAVLAADAKVNSVAVRINTFFDESKIEDAQKLQPDLAAAKKEYAAANALYLEMAGVERSNPATSFVPAGGATPQQPAKDMRASPEYMAQWLNALRSGVTPKNVAQHGTERFGLLLNALTETLGDPVGEDGGFLNPIEFDGKIHELMREYVDLANSVNVESVNTLTGWRVMEQFAAALPLTKVTTELTVKTAEGEQPKFDKIDYALDEYFDFLIVGNSLLADTPVNIMAYLAKWFSKKVVLTHNSLILALINAISPTACTDPAKALGAIKTALNKTLDPAFSASASLFTNQTGLDILDQLDDGTGRPLLQPDPSIATAFRVKGRPVVILSDAHWANLSGPTKSRIAIGDGREFVTLFQRSAFEFASTTTGGDAWRSNATEVRGIARLDAQKMDAGAMCLLTVNEVKA
ncbi:phage major capsid protein [bacterium]|nr:MAG: phage major capsid protein [bacterium]